LNAITLRSGKQREEPKVTQGEEGEGVVTDKGEESMEDKGELVLEGDVQGKHEEIPKPRIVESYRPPVPFL